MTVAFRLLEWAMKILSGFGVVLFLLGNQAAAIQINYQVYQNDSAIQKAFGGKNNGDMLCWPSSLAHRMKYLKAHGFPRLKLSENDVDNVRKFEIGRASCRERV